MEKTRKKLWIAFAGIFAVIACFLLFNPNTVKNTYAAADANITNQTGLGLGINVVTAGKFQRFLNFHIWFSTTRRCKRCRKVLLI